MNLQQLQRILKAISLTEEAELTCAGLDEEQLAAHADLELTGQGPASQMPDVHQHLALCPDCRRDYHHVLATLRLKGTSEWIEPASEPELDLSFLPLAADEPSSWSQVADRVRRYVTEVPALMLHELQQVGELPTSLQLRPAAGAPAKMRGPESDTPIVAFRLTDTAERFAVDLRFRRAGAGVVWIRVQPRDIKSEELLPGATVGLHESDGRLLEMRTVPAAGATQLQDVPINRDFLLRLEHEGRAWEIPFSLHIEASGDEVSG